MDISIGGTGIASSDTLDLELDRYAKHDFPSLASEAITFLTEKGIQIKDSALDIAGLLTKLFKAGYDLESN